MPSPTPVAETYISCVGNTIVFGTGTVWNATVTSGSLTKTYEVDEMTNNVGAGAYEDVKTVYKWEGDFAIAYVAASPPPLHAGDIWPVVISSTVTGGPVITGNFRVNGFQYPMLDPKKGLMINGKLTSQGPVVLSLAP